MFIIISRDLERNTMVSIVLLTTEEVLQRNGFWYCLDSLWVAEELEPFEEVRPEHAYSKPLSKDVYYTKFPDIPRSESEDENSLSLSGFRSKHREWKTNICVRRFDAQRKNSLQMSISIRSTNSNTSLNDQSRRVTSLVKLSEVNQNTSNTVSRCETDDDKIKSFFERLIANVPPPPITELQEISVDKNNCIIQSQSEEKLFDDIDLPDYADFAKNKMLETNNEQETAPGTSTLKKLKKRVSFKLDRKRNKSDFEHSESWYESIYGVSDVIAPNVNASSDEDESVDFLNDVCEMEYDELSREMIQNCDNISSVHVPNDSEDCTSWSEIMTYCGVDNSILRFEDASKSVEDIISRSHCADAKILDCLVDSDDEEVGYAKFAIYKIHQTIKIEDHMIDSSSMRDFSCEDNHDSAKTDIVDSGNSFYGNIYRLAPIDVDDSVNVAWI